MRMEKRAKLLAKQEELMKDVDRMSLLYRAAMSVFGDDFIGLTPTGRTVLVIDIEDIVTVEDRGFSEAALVLRRRIEPATLDSYVATLLA